MYRDNYVSLTCPACGAERFERPSRAARRCKSCTGPENARKHGLSYSRVYRIWSHMKARCENSSHRAYPSYGGRGITVCDRWFSFEDFLQDMGQPQGRLSIDRIDNDGPYSPENCRWATYVEQNNNKRGNRLICIGRETKTFTQWLRFFNMNESTVRHRMKVGMSEQEALTAPNHRGRRRDIVGGRRLREAKGYRARTGERKRRALEALTGCRVEVI